MEISKTKNSLFRKKHSLFGNFQKKNLLFGKKHSLFGNFQIVNVFVFETDKNGSGRQELKTNFLLLLKLDQQEVFCFTERESRNE